MKVFIFSRKVKTEYVLDKYNMLTLIMVLSYYRRSYRRCYYQYKF